MSEYYATEKEHETVEIDPRESLRNYTDAKMKADMYFRRLSDETEVLFSHFVKYAKRENSAQSHRFSELVENFYYEVLNMECDDRDKVIRASLTKRFKWLMKKRIVSNPRDQIKLDEYLNE